ncbi:DUF5808 domain-containing protein [Streptomyces asiaticus]
MAREFWDPDSDAFFTPHAFGVGYGLNLARVAVGYAVVVDRVPATTYSCRPLSIRRRRPAQ